MKKTNILKVLLSITLVLSLSLTGCSSSKDTSSSNQASDKPEDPVALKVMYSASLCGIPLHIAKQLQFFEAEGLKEDVNYKYVTSSLSGVEMLSSGQADISFGMLSAMLAPLDNGLEAKTVIGIHTGCVQVLAGSKTGIKSVKDLKGKKIGIQQMGSSTHTVIQRALAAEGIGSIAGNMEVEFVVFSKDDLPLALKNGAVDAIGIGDPQATILINEGQGVPILNSATDPLLKDEYCCALWVRNEVLQKYPKQVAKVVSAIQKASVWVDQNVDLAAQIQLDNNWLVGDLKIDQQVLKTYKYKTSVSEVQKGLTRNIIDMKKLGLIKADTDTDQLSKESFFKLPGLPDDVTEKVVPPIDPQTQLKKK